jgi:hypothetical protein
VRSALRAGRWAELTGGGRRWCLEEQASGAASRGDGMRRPGMAPSGAGRTRRRLRVAASGGSDSAWRAAAAHGQR